MLSLLETINQLIWGFPLLILLVGTGVLLTIRLKLIQVLKLPDALKLVLKPNNKGTGDISSFGAICTELAAVLGTGNIVGVATAIATGGPGALFWMWVAAFFGMATKYAEGVLGIKYRILDENGNISGGPMYYILNGMGKNFKPIAVLFAISGMLVALLGMGTFTQVNAISSTIENTLGIPSGLIGITLAILTAVITFGGLPKIAKVAQLLIPFMASGYMLICLLVLVINLKAIMPALQLIIESAFTTQAAVGGFGGATVMIALRTGVARGVFSNEAGLGSSSIAVAAAKSEWAAEQGLISMSGTFLDTLINTLTGLTLMVTGAWNMAEIQGSALMEMAFNSILPSIGDLAIGSVLLMISLTLFAYTTILGWNYYGERCCEFLFGVKAIKPYRLLFILMISIGAFLELSAIWLIADIVNGLMVFPNLIALFALSGVVVQETHHYLTHFKHQKIQLVRKG